MRTTIDIEDDLMRRIRERAHRAGVPIKRIVNRALRKSLTEKPAGRTRPYKSPSFSMGPIVSPQLNIDKALAIADTLEQDAAGREMEVGK